MSIQRYRQPDTCNGIDMIAHSKGKWVRYAAFTSRAGHVNAKLESLTASYDELLKALKDLVHGYTRLPSAEFREQMSDLMFNAAQAIRKAKGGAS